MDPSWLPIAALALALFVVAVVWGVPRSIGDLWVGLAAGRDILAGQLGRPDDWAFNTAGRVWINQNWGAHLLSWLAWSSGGEAGLLVLKAFLIGAVWLAATLSARVVGAGRVPAMVAAAGVLLGSQGYIDLRPNLVTLAMAPLTLWLIQRSGGPPGGAPAAARPQRIWWAAAAVVLWANLHGGFALGLLMLWLWAGLHLVRGGWRRTPATGADRTGSPALWALPAAAAAATLLAGIATPFGFTNLLEPFVIARDAGWHNVPEWRPLWAQASYDSVWGFFAVLGAMAVLAALRATGSARALPAARHEAPIRGVSTAMLFTAAISGLTLVMAIGARRFVPLSLVVMTPILALLLDQVGRARGRRVLPLAMGAVLAGALLLLPGELQTYDAGNPRLPPGDSFFVRMHRLSTDFPVSAARFINANRIGMSDAAGLRALVAWEWEGYVHLTAPQLKVMMGGRAQQIYSPEDLDRWEKLLAAGTAEQARALRMSLALLHAGPGTYGEQVTSLLRDGWVVLFAASPVMLLVDASDPGMRELIRRAEAGELAYPDERTRLASLTWIRFRGLATGQGSPAELISAARAALAAAPDPALCGMIAQAAERSVELQSEGITALEEVVRRLDGLDPFTAPEGERALLTRRAARNALAALYDRAGQSDRATNSRTAAQADGALLELLTRRWRL